MALLLKSIGNALAKVQDDGRDGVDAPQQRQGQQSRAKAAQGGGGQLSGVAAEKLQGLRVLMVLMHLLGEHLGRHALQVRCHRESVDCNNFLVAAPFPRPRPGLTVQQPGHVDTTLYTLAPTLTCLPACLPACSACLSVCSAADGRPVRVARILHSGPAQDAGTIRLAVLCAATCPTRP